MDRLIYLSMAGAKATLQRQDTLANNLANASTTGFRAEMQAFRAVPVRGDGASTRVYALESTIGHDTRPGPVSSTGTARKAVSSARKPVVLALARLCASTSWRCSVALAPAMAR